MLQTESDTYEIIILEIMLLIALMSCNTCLETRSLNTFKF